MKIDLNRFFTEENIIFDEDLSFNKEDLLNAGIINISKCHVNGELDKYDDEAYHLNIKVTGQMILECARSLEEVPYNFQINIEKSFGLEGNDEENLKIDGNILDIFPIIWENIVLEKPSRIIKENNNGLTEGDGWSLTDEIKKENNSQLSELDKLLKMEEEK